MANTLRELDLSGNRLQTLPQALRVLRSLVRLTLHGYDDEIDKSVVILRELSARGVANICKFPNPVLARFCVANI